MTKNKMADILCDETKNKDVNDLYKLLKKATKKEDNQTDKDKVKNKLEEMEKP